MNWDAIGALGQVLGSAAVFVTLAYVAIQVRLARQETARAISRNRSDDMRDLAMHLSQSEWLSRIVAKTESAFGAQVPPFVQQVVERAGLSLPEAQALLFHNFAWWSSWSQQILRVAELTDGERAELEVAIRGQYQSGFYPTARLWYESVKAGLNPDAVRYVDDVLAKSV